MTDTDNVPENADSTEPPERLADADLSCGDCGKDFESFQRLVQHTASCRGGPDSESE